MDAEQQAPESGCLKVSSKSSPASVAGAIAGMVKDGVGVEIQAVGAGAVNQAVKAIAISRGFLSPIGIEIACIPSFADIVIDGEYRTSNRRFRSWRVISFHIALLFSIRSELYPYAYSIHEYDFLRPHLRMPDEQA